MNSDKILASVKAALAICEEDDSFDTELVMHINSVLANLTQIGVGPEDGFSVVDGSEAWSDFIGDSKTLQNVKTYVYLKVKTIFDPPASSVIMDAYKTQINELEFRMFVTTDNNKNSK